MFSFDDALVEEISEIKSSKNEPRFANVESLGFINFCSISFLIEVIESLPEKSIPYFLPTRINEALKSLRGIKLRSTISSRICIPPLTPFVDEINLGVVPRANSIRPLPSVEFSRDQLIAFAIPDAELGLPDAHTSPNFNTKYTPPSPSTTSLSPSFTSPTIKLSG